MIFKDSMNRQDAKDAKEEQEKDISELVFSAFFAPSAVKGLCLSNVTRAA